MTYRPAQTIIYFDQANAGKEPGSTPITTRDENEEVRELSAHLSELTLRSEGRISSIRNDGP